MNDNDSVMVEFRTWLDAPFTGDVIALFPDIPADVRGKYCMCYEHVGQHGSADYSLVRRNTRPATTVESASLKRELEAQGYTLIESTMRDSENDYWYWLDQEDCDAHHIFIGWTYTYLDSANTWQSITLDRYNWAWYRAWHRGTAQVLPQAFNLK